MNRRRRRPRLFVIIIMGVISGIAFLIIDQSRPTQVIETSPSQSASPTSVSIASVDATSTPQFSEALAVTPSPTPIIARDLGPDIENAALLIPNAGIVAPIVRVYLDESSWDVSNLGNSIGHLEGTRWIPENGNVVLSGHVELSDGRLGIFANLHELEIGDRVIITQDGNDFHYDITSVAIHEPTDLAPIYPSSENRLTLITCGSYDFISDSYLERVVVIAEEVKVNKS